MPTAMSASSPRKAHAFAILPVEVVNEIFIHCLPTGVEEPRPIPTQAPLLLCHVSSYWRSAAIADPRLWKRMTLNPKLHNVASLESISRTTKQMVDQALLWLVNAKDLGLDMDLTIPAPCYGLTDADVAEPSFADISDKWNLFIQPILVERASRFKALRLSFGVGSLLQPFFFAEEQGTLSRLESLTLKGDRLQVTDDSSQAGKLTLKRFTSAARLTKVAILVKNRIPFPLQLPSNFLPWSQLTHLMITMPCSGSFWKRVLVSCLQLEAGYINIEYGVVPDDCDPALPSVGYIGLPRLKILDVTFHDEYTSAYFEDFRLPVLQRLLVACDFGSGFPTLAWLPSAQNGKFLQELRSLTSLTLSYQNMIEAELVGMLKCTVELEELVLDSYLVDHKSFFRALAVKVDSDAKPLLPKLRVFRFFLEYFADVPPTTFDEEDFLEVMISRSEVAREVANNFCDDNFPAPQPVSDSELSDSSSDMDDEDDDEEEKESTMDVDIAPTLSTTATTLTTTVSLPPSKSTPRTKLPLASKLVVPIRQVELSTDATDQVLFKRLKRFMGEMEKYNEGHAPAVPGLVFRLDFSSPSEWALQDSEPSWF